MDTRIIRHGDGTTHDFESMRLKEMLVSDAWPFSINWIQRTSDESREGYETEQDVAFYVLEGEGEVIIDGTSHTLNKGDLVAFARGTHWRFLKGLTLLAVSSPPYDRTKRKYVEES